MAVNGMASDVEGNHGITLDVKDRPKVPLDHHRMNGPLHDGRKTVDFVSLQTGVKWRFLEDRPGRPRGSLLRIRQGIKGLPECFRGEEAILYAWHGGASVMAVSMSTN